LFRYEDEHECIYRIVDQDETWVHHFDPKSKKKNRACSGSKWLTPSGEIQEDAISREDDVFNFFR
jgi:hypothetical protein